ncbi:MAG: 2,3-bisphosphoglycerate-independent phosphoglycerate mutase [Promethearchaeota archaeon]|nr:MAG: 2,3-bisphosphoglycerate-independent phosphoglycerate mutase [Candidatus Lokiarchaeota archaeon]
MKDWDLYYKNLVRESDYKVVFLILDGMPDIYVKELKGTPLQAAKTPHMDALAKDGASGLLYPTIEPHIPIGSGPAHLALFGYELERYPGRGPLEALGVGLPVPQGSVVVRVNFATMDQQGVIIDRRAGRISGEDAGKLVERFKNLECEKFWCLDYSIHHTKGYRGVLIIRGDNASAAISDSDPREVGQPILEVVPESGDKTSQITANFMNWFIQAAQAELMTDNETQANTIVTRGAGAIKLYESFTDRYKFKNPIFISSYPLYRGIARFLRIDVQEPDVSNRKASIKDKCVTAGRLLKDHDMTILHIKDPDIAGEDGNFLKKKEIIEEIDTCLPYITDQMDEMDTLVLTSDHSTPASMREHSGHPIPLLMKGPFVRVDPVDKFSEIDCIHGALGTFRAIELMNLILMSTKRLKTFWP